MMLLDQMALKHGRESSLGDGVHHSSGKICLLTELPIMTADTSCQWLTLTLSFRVSRVHDASKRARRQQLGLPLPPVYFYKQ